MVFLVLMENEKLWCNEMGYVRCNGHAASAPFLTLLSSGGTLLSLSSFTASSNGQFLSFQLSFPPSLLQRPPAFQLSSSLSSDPSARARPSPSLPPSLYARACGVGLFLISPPSFPAIRVHPAGIERGSERRRHGLTNRRMAKPLAVRSSAATAGDQSGRSM